MRDSRACTSLIGLLACTQDGLDFYVFYIVDVYSFYAIKFIHSLI